MPRRWQFANPANCAIIYDKDIIEAVIIFLVVTTDD